MTVRARILPRWPAGSSELVGKPLEVLPADLPIAYNAGWLSGYESRRK